MSDPSRSPAPPPTTAATTTTRPVDLQPQQEQAASPSAAGAASHPAASAAAADFLQGVPRAQGTTDHSAPGPAVRERPDGELASKGEEVGGPLEPSHQQQQLQPQAAPSGPSTATQDINADVEMAEPEPATRTGTTTTTAAAEGPTPFLAAQDASDAISAAGSVPVGAQREQEQGAAVQGGPSATQDVPAKEVGPPAGATPASATLERGDNSPSRPSAARPTSRPTPPPPELSPQPPPALAAEPVVQALVGSATEGVELMGAARELALRRLDVDGLASVGGLARAADAGPAPSYPAAAATAPVGGGGDAAKVAMGRDAPPVQASTSQAPAQSAAKAAAPNAPAVQRTFALALPTAGPSTTPSRPSAPPPASRMPSSAGATDTPPTHSPSVSTLAGRRIRTFPPKKPREPPAVAAAAASAGAAGARASGSGAGGAGSGGSSSQAGMPRATIGRNFASAPPPAPSHHHQQQQQQASGSRAPPPPAAVHPAPSLALHPHPPAPYASAAQRASPLPSLLNTVPAPGAIGYNPSFALAPHPHAPGGPDAYGLVAGGTAAYEPFGEGAFVPPPPAHLPPGWVRPPHLSGGHHAPPHPAPPPPASALPPASPGAHARPAPPRPHPPPAPVVFASFAPTPAPAPVGPGYGAAGAPPAGGGFRPVGAVGGKRAAGAAGGLSAVPGAAAGSLAASSSTPPPAGATYPAGPGPFLSAAAAAAAVDASGAASAPSFTPTTAAGAGAHLRPPPDPARAAQISREADAIYSAYLARSARGREAEAAKAERREKRKADDELKRAEKARRKEEKAKAAPANVDAEGNPIPKRRGRPPKLKPVPAADGAQGESSTSTATEAAPDVKGKAKAGKPGARKRNVLVDPAAVPSAELFPSDEEPAEEELIMEDWPVNPPPRPPTPPKPRPPKAKVAPKPSPRMPSTSSASSSTATVVPAALPTTSTSLPDEEETLVVDPTPAIRPAVRPAPTKSAAPRASSPKKATPAKPAARLPARPPPIASSSKAAAPTPASPAPESTSEGKPSRVRRGLPGIYKPPAPKARKSTASATSEEHAAPEAGEGLAPQLAEGSSSAHPAAAETAAEQGVSPPTVAAGLTPVAPFGPTLSVEVPEPSPSPASKSEPQPETETTEATEAAQGGMNNIQVLTMLQSIAPLLSKPSAALKGDAPAADLNTVINKAALTEDMTPAAPPPADKAAKTSVDKAATPPAPSAAPVDGSPALPAASLPSSPLASPTSPPPRASISSRPSPPEIDLQEEIIDPLPPSPPAAAANDAVSASEGEDEQEVRAKPVTLVAFEDEMLWEEELLTVEPDSAVGKASVEDEDPIMEEPEVPVKLKKRSASPVKTLGRTASPSKVLARSVSPAKISSQVTSTVETSPTKAAAPTFELEKEEEDDENGGSLILMDDQPSAPASMPPSPPAAPPPQPKRSSEAKPRLSTTLHALPTASTRRTNREQRPEPVKPPSSSSKTRAAPVPTASTRSTRRESTESGSGPRRTSSSADCATSLSPVEVPAVPSPSAPKSAAASRPRSPSPVGSIAGVFTPEGSVAAASDREGGVIGVSIGEDAVPVVKSSSSTVKEVFPRRSPSPPGSVLGVSTAEGDLAGVSSEGDNVIGVSTAQDAADATVDLSTDKKSPHPRSPSSVRDFADLPAAEESVASVSDKEGSVIDASTAEGAASDVLNAAAGPSTAENHHSTAESSEQEDAEEEEDLIVAAVGKELSSTAAAASKPPTLVPTSPSAAGSLVVDDDEDMIEIEDPDDVREPILPVSPLSAAQQQLLDAIGDDILLDESEKIMHPADGSLGLSGPFTAAVKASLDGDGVISDDEIVVDAKAYTGDDNANEQPSATPSRKRIKLTHKAWEDKQEDGSVALTDEVIERAESIASEDYENMLQMEAGHSEDEVKTWQEWEDMHRPTKEEVDEYTAFVKEKGPHNFIHHYVIKKQIKVITLLLAFNVKVPKSYRNPERNEMTLIPILKMGISKILTKRDRLPQYSTWEDAVELIRTRKNIVVLSGAGISVSCGIPDFRSADGLYAKLQEEGQYDLEDPQQMFDIRYFKQHPEVFYSFARQIYPTNFTPSPCHRWIKKLEDEGKLLRNYTQNIDTLERKVGIKKVLQCHGSFATASCLRCRRRMPGSDIEDDIMECRIPVCSPCQEEEKEKMTMRVRRRKKSKKKKNPWAESESESDNEADRAWARKLVPAIIKPDITFFGEELGDRFEKRLEVDRESVDLLIVIGSSLSVAPVSDLLAILPHSVPQIMINKTVIKSYNPDIHLVGDADPIILLLAQKLGWTLPAPKGGKRKISLKSETPAAEPRQLGDTNYWIFKGASRSDLQETVFKTLPKDVDTSFVQSDDEDEDKDDDLLVVESDDGRHDSGEDEHHHLGPQHSSSGDTDDEHARHHASRRRAGKARASLEEDVMEEVPEPEEEAKQPPKQMAPRSPSPSKPPARPTDPPEWVFEEFDDGTALSPVGISENDDEADADADDESEDDLLVISSEPERAPPTAQSSSKSSVKRPRPSTSDSEDDIGLLKVQRTLSPPASNRPVAPASAASSSRSAPGSSAKRSIEGTASAPPRPVAVAEPLSKSSSRPPAAGPSRPSTSQAVRPPVLLGSSRLKPTSVTASSAPGRSALKPSSASSSAGKRPVPRAVEPKPKQSKPNIIVLDSSGEEEEDMITM